MNLIIDQGHFNRYEITSEQIDRLTKAYPNCIVVKNRKEYVDKHHHYVWYVGQIVLTSEKFELGKWVYFPDCEYTADAKGEECLAVVHEDKVNYSIPIPEGLDNTDSTSKNEFYNLNYFRQKRIHEAEKKYPFKMIWALNRVAFLRKKGFKAINACKLVAMQSELDYQNIFNGYSKRAIHMRWAKKDYENQEID